MLVLSRKEDQSIVFPNLGISIEIVRVQGNKVCVGVEAPKAIRVVRGELQSVADPNDKVCSPDFQLGQFMEVLPIQTRNELREHLNVAGLAVHTAQKQCELGGLENAEFFLAKAVEALAQLNKMFEVSQAADPTDCVKEPQAGYALARTPRSLLSPSPLAIEGLAHASHQPFPIKSFSISSISFAVTTNVA